MMQRIGFNRWHALVSAGIVSLLATASWSQKLIWLGTLGGDESRGFGVSADGTVVVGNSMAQGTTKAYRWTARTRMVDLGTLGGSYATAYAVSADGSVIVGYSNRQQPGEAPFCWTQCTGMQPLPMPNNARSGFATSISDDGKVIVGAVNLSTDQTRGIRWNLNNDQWSYEILGTLGGTVSAANGVSGNGLVVVGDSRLSNGLIRAVRWVNGIIQELNMPPSYWGYAKATSFDGTVVVGSAENRPCRWVLNDSNSGTWSFEFLTTSSGVAFDLSADGTVVVGYYAGTGGIRAFRWTTRGLEDLNQKYSHLLGDGSILRVAIAISPDGRYIVGAGDNATTSRYEAFLLDTRLDADVNSDGRVDDTDLLLVLFSFGEHQ